MRHNPFLAEYGLLNPRRRGGGRRRSRYRHNPPAFSAATIRNPMGVVMPGLWGLGGVYVPITVGNYLVGLLAPTLPMLAAPDMLGGLLRAGVRGAVAWGADRYALGAVGGDRGAFRTGAAIGIIGSLVMDFLGRPLLIGPGDQALSPTYAFDALTSGVAGLRAYAPATRMLTAMGETGAYAPRPRLAGSLGRNPIGSAFQRMYGY